MKRKNDIELESFLKKLGNKIKKEREKTGLTQEEMDTDPFAINYKYYQKLEYGKKNMTVSTILKICKKFNIRPKDLFDVED